jgi:hypothetical protein
VTLVKLLRAWELRAIWVPDTVREAVRDLTCAREVAMIDLKKKRHLLSFLLRHGRIFANGKKTPVATTAIARELAAFLWAIGQQVAPQKPAPPKGRGLIIPNRLSRTTWARWRLTLTSPWCAGAAR